MTDRDMTTVPLYLIASAPAEERPDPAWLDRVEAAVRGGAGAVQLRQKAVKTATRLAWLQALRERLGRRALLIVNDDLEAARDAVADGVHLGREDAARLAGWSPGSAPPDGAAIGRGLARARQELPPAALLGTSTRSAEELARSWAHGADHAGFGAMASTRTKADTRLAEPSELDAWLRARPRTPVFPIGGVGPELIPELVARGVRRAAVGAAILSAPDPEAAARRLYELLTG